MRTFPTIVATLTVFALLPIAAHAAPRRHPRAVDEPGRIVVQDTRTIIHNPDGTTTIIVRPKRSYLDPGTEVSVGATRSLDYALPPGGDPGRPYWFYGPSESSGPAAGGYMTHLPYYLPGYNPYTPF